MGRPPNLLEEVYEHWPIESLPLLPPDIRGLYVLYDSEKRPIYVGISGRGAKQRVRQRFWAEYYRYRYWGWVRYFSVYTFKVEPLYDQIETLILRALGNGLPGNTNRKGLPRTVVRHPKPQERYDGHFIQKVADKEGYVLVGEKNAGKRVRVEIGPAEEKVKKNLRR
ncbi:MAG TPA: hypothetical protein VMI55_08270 [Thermoplasmata archaeon]|nr:hypothetical protein [Thermoplasmata archaeon]